MASFFRNVLYSGLGSTETKVLTTGNINGVSRPTANTTVIGLSLTNVTENVVLASIRLVDISGSVSAPYNQGYYIKEVAVPPNQSVRVVNGGEKLILAPSTEVYIRASDDASLDLVLSCVEIV